MAALVAIFVSSGAWMLVIAKTIAMIVDTRNRSKVAEAELTRAKADYIKQEAAAAELKARTDAAVQASQLRERDLATAQAATILETLRAMQAENARHAAAAVEREAAATVIRENTRQLAIQSNQQLTEVLRKQQESAAGGVTHETIADNLKHRETDAAVIAGDMAPPPPEVPTQPTSAPKPATPPPTATPSAPVGELGGTIMLTGTLTPPDAPPGEGAKS